MRDKPRLVPVVGYALSPDIGQVVAADAGQDAAPRVILEGAEQAWRG